MVDHLIVVSDVNAMVTRHLVNPNQVCFFFILRRVWQRWILKYIKFFGASKLTAFFSFFLSKETKLAGDTLCDYEHTIFLSYGPFWGLNPSTHVVVDVLFALSYLSAMLSVYEVEGICLLRELSSSPLTANIGARNRSWILW